MLFLSSVKLIQKMNILFWCLLLFVILLENTRCLQVSIQEIRSSAETGYFDLDLSVAAQGTIYDFTITHIPPSFSLLSSNTLTIPASDSDIFMEQFIDLTYSSASLNISDSIKVGIIFNKDYIFIDNSHFPTNNIAQPITFKFPASLTQNSSSILTLEQIMKQKLAQANSSPRFISLLEDQSYQSLPSLKEVESLIEQNVLVVILRLINNLVKNRRIDCIFKIGYMSEIIGRMYSLYFELKKEIEDLQIEVDLIEENKNRKKDSIIAWEKEHKNLKLNELNYQIAHKYAQLSKIHLDEQETLKTIVELEKNLTVSRNSRQSTIYSLDNLYNQINPLKLQLATKTLPNSIRQQKQKELGDLQVLKQTLNQNINQLNIKIQTDSYYRFLNQSFSDQLRIRAITVQYEIDQLLKEKSIVENRAIELSKAIMKQKDELFLIIADENMKIDQILRLSARVEVLQKNIPIINKILQSYSLTCFGLDGNIVTTLNQLNQIIYLFDYAKFIGFVRNLFGNSFTNLEKIGHEEIMISRINVLTDLWKNNFGIEDPDKGLIPNYGGFSCLAKESAVEIGIILEIRDNIVRVSKGSTDFFLLLGACTTLYSVNSALPKQGNFIFWRGQSIGTNIYDTYMILSL